MEGLLILHSDGATPSHRSIRNCNSSKKVKPKRKKIDSGSPQNHSKKLPTKNAGTQGGGLLKSSPSILLVPSQKPPLLPLPSNLSPNLSSFQLSPIIKAKNPKTAINSGSSLELMKGKTDEAKKSDVLITSFSPLDPGPSNLPMKVFGIFKATGGAEEKSGCIFSLSPPPSSLPLPKFSLKQKENCRTEATGDGGSRVDLGATDNLRRLLRLP